MLRETERDKLIRTGKITPFADMEGLDKGRLPTNTSATRVPSVKPRERVRGLSESQEKEFEEKRYHLFVKCITLIAFLLPRQKALVDPKTTARVPRKRKIEDSRKRFYNLSSVRKRFADDGDDEAYRARMEDWDNGLLRKRRKSAPSSDRAEENSCTENAEEYSESSNTQNTINLEAKRVVSRGTEWTCTACTFVNSSSGELACEICGTRRPRSHRRDDPAHDRQPDADRMESKKGGVEEYKDDEDDEYDAEHLEREEESSSAEEQDSDLMPQDYLTEEGEDVEFTGGYKLPDFIYDNLFDYQQTGKRKNDYFVAHPL